MHEVGRHGKKGGENCEEGVGEEGEKDLRLRGGGHFWKQMHICRG